MWTPQGRTKIVNKIGVSTLVKLTVDKQTGRGKSVHIMDGMSTKEGFHCNEIRRQVICISYRLFLGGHILPIFSLTGHWIPVLSCQKLVTRWSNWIWTRPSYQLERIIVPLSPDWVHLEFCLAESMLLICSSPSYQTICKETSQCTGQLCKKLWTF